MSEWLTVLELIGALIVAGFLGGLVGLDREMKRHWAGLRTHIIVSLGAALFVAVGQVPSAAGVVDLGRVIQGIAAGIGFIGAGTILKLTDRLEVKGLTTASSIWMAAAVGVAAGLRQYLLALAATVLTLVVLTVVPWLEGLIARVTKSPEEGDEASRTRKSEKDASSTSV
jgi:putative Mg2+ transporter-C (MgtC) family protein